jgi:ABC-2 type transport system permease protein
VNETLLLGRRAVREVWRIPAATIPALFIPVFFLVVNLGQVNKIFSPLHTPFLHGQHYVAFQVPVSLVFAVSSATSGLAMVTDIDIGYLDKLLAAPIRRTAIVWGRLAADLVRGIAVSAIVLAVGYAFGARVKSGAIGVVLLIVLSALWGVAYAGIAIAIALKTKNVQTTNASFLIFFPLLFLTPNFVPMDLLAGPLQTIARINPVTYVITGLRDIVLFGDIHWGSLGACVLTIGVTGVVLTWLSMRALATFAD